MSEDPSSQRPQDRSVDRGFPGVGLISWFVRNPVAANLLMVLFLIGGALTAVTMRTEVFPRIDPQAIQVTVIYPGATPEEIEEAITRRVEEAVLGIDGVDRVRSVASESRGSITVELRDFADRQTVKDDVETAVDSLVDFPPEDAEQPQIRLAQSVGTVVTMVLTGPVDERALRQAGEQVERDLLSRDDISGVNLRGVRSYEISINVREDDLRRFGMSFDEVAGMVRASSIDLSGGEIRTQSGEILLRTDARRETGEEFEQIILRSAPDGSRIRLGDVADIIDGFQEEPLTTIYNNQPAVFIDVQVQGNEDLLGLREATFDYLETATLPPGIDIQISLDQSELFADRISLLARNAVIGFTLVFLLLVLMLDLRLAFWVSMGVPISFLGGFALFGAAGVTLNFITTFGLIIVLGIVVDDAIVVGENTDRERRKGLSAHDASVAGVTGVAAPVLVGVLTTMAAFGPLIFSGGSLGEVLRPVPIVVICILGISLIEAFLILPAHLSHSGNWSRGMLARIQNGVADAIQSFAEGPLQSWARFAGRMRYFVAIAGIIVLTLIFSLLITGTVRFIFFPTIEDEEISADLQMPEGAPYESTEVAAYQMLDAIETLAEDYEAEGQTVIDSVGMVIGGRTSLFGGPGTTSTTTVASNLAQFTIILTPASQRTISSSDVERDWRERIGIIPGAEQLSVISSAGPQTDDIAYELSHPNNETLEAAVTQFASQLGRINGVEEIDDGFNLGKRQLNFQLTPAGEAAGLRPVDIARQVRQAFFGEEVQRIQRGREEVRVYVRYPEDERRRISDLDQFRVRTSDGVSIPLSVAANVVETRSFTTIDRVDGRRIIELTGDVDEVVITPGAVRTLIEEQIIPELEETYPGLRWRLSGAGREQSEDFASLQQGMLIALVIMYTLLATQLRSYIQPLVILIAIPFGVAGAILGHLFMGFDVSFPSMFGMVALSGVVVNASIVLVDRYNQNVGLGMELPDAVAEAVSRRFRPILITTLTTALGLLPIITETSTQAQFLIPMAISLGGGLVFASTLIMLLLPAIILIIEDIRLLPTRLSGAAQESSESA